ncbi:serine/threonine protein kinase [Coemansia asiatica]|nr:serine/threonine protein kinase [Coemansia asiatica]
MGVISDTVKRVENDLHHHNHHNHHPHHHQQNQQQQIQQNQQNQQKHHQGQHAKTLHDVNAQHPYHPSPLASGFAAGPPSSSSSSAMLSDASGSQQSLRSSRRSSLKIRTDSANQQQVTLSPQPMTAGAKPPSPFASLSHSQQQKQSQQPQQHRQQQLPPQPTPLPTSATAPKTTSVAPIMIKRNTSFSQRIHNLLHRDKSQKHQPQSQGPASPLQMRHAPAGNGASGSLGYETPTIAYRTPTTHTSQSNPSANASATASADNSPPNGASPHNSSANLVQDNNASVSSMYHAQRNFEPVLHGNVFSMGNTNLRSVERHNSQIRDSINMGLVYKDKASRSPRPEASSSGSYATDVAVADDLSQAMRDTDIVEPSASRSVEGSTHSVSREPSQNTLHQNQSAVNAHRADETTPAAAGAAVKSTAHVPANKEDTNGHNNAAAASAASEAQEGAEDVDKPARKLNESRESTLSEKKSPIRHAHTPSELADVKQRLAAGTTRDPSLLPTDASASAPPEPCAAVKKPCHHYSTHTATLNQFGRQTKVIGKGTGGTVRLLQGAEVNTRPPSLRSGPPSSHNGDESVTYVPSQHKLFAVKEFRKRRQDETPRAYMKKVTSEFCIGSSVHQENVIETLDLIFEGDHVYEIMEYCPHDLFTFVAMGDMDLEETFCWFKQVCQGVQYLHKIGIAHRDLKLENCLVTDRGIVKIIDFGCATVFKTPFQKEPSKVVGVCGSDPYIAPEVLQSRRQIPYYAQVADIWSVGIMYMCMTLLKFPWRIADIDTDRNYGSYIRNWPRGREKLFAQLPKLRHEGQKVIEGMVYPEVKGRLSMDDVMESEWMKEIDICHTSSPASSHTHRMKTE